MRTQDDVFRQLQHQDKRELDWVEKMEKECMTDKQERWKQPLLNVEALCPSLGDRVCRTKFDTVTTVEEWVLMIGVRQNFIACFMSWRSLHCMRQPLSGFSLSSQPNGAARSRLERRHF